MRRSFGWYCDNVMGLLLLVWGLITLSIPAKALMTFRLDPSQVPVSYYLLAAIGFVCVACGLWGMHRAGRFDD